MMSSLIEGFQVAFQLPNLFACFIGVLIGTLVGVLPGIGATAAIAILLPVTFQLSPVSAIIMLAGIYYGSMYGGSTTSILLNIPGESASVVTTLDGHHMALQGRAGAALGISAFGSFIAGTLGLFGIVYISEPLAKIALEFGPPEYCSLICFGLVTLVHLTGESLSRTAAVAFLGLILSCVGLDTFRGVLRFDFGISEFMNGIGLVPLIMGIYGIGEVLINFDAGEGKGKLVQTDYRGLLPTLQDWKDSLGAILRGSFLGFFVGLLPGGGATISSFLAYGMERKLSKTPEKFGTGLIQGVASPEAANNAAVVGNFIPLLIIGIPTGAIMAMLMGALIIHGVNPGPQLLAKNPEIFWGFVASMYIGNVMLMVLNLPMIPLWVQILKVPNKILFPLILLFTTIGSYSVDNSIFEVKLMIAFGVLGYFLKKFNWGAAPLIMAFVLGDKIEESFRQSMILSRGSLEIFIQRPVSLGFLILIAVVLLTSFISYLKRGKRIKT